MAEPNAQDKSVAGVDKDLESLSSAEKLSEAEVERHGESRGSPPNLTSPRGAESHKVALPFLQEPGSPPRPTSLLQVSRGAAGSQPLSAQPPVRLRGGTHRCRPAPPPGSADDQLCPARCSHWRGRTVAELCHLVARLVRPPATPRPPACKFAGPALPEG